VLRVKLYYMGLLLHDAKPARRKTFDERAGNSSSLH
jgi:hypothetical protein